MRGKWSVLQTFQAKKKKVPGAASAQVASCNRVLTSIGCRSRGGGGGRAAQVSAPRAVELGRPNHCWATHFGRAFHGGSTTPHVAPLSPSYTHRLTVRYAPMGGNGGTQSRTPSLTHTRAHTHARAQPHMHRHTHAHTHTCTHARTHAPTHARTPTHMHLATHLATHPGTHPTTHSLTQSVTTARIKARIKASHKLLVWEPADRSSPPTLFPWWWDGVLNRGGRWSLVLGCTGFCLWKPSCSRMPPTGHSETNVETLVL